MEQFSYVHTFDMYRLKYFPQTLKLLIHLILTIFFLLEIERQLRENNKKTILW